MMFLFDFIWNFVVRLLTEGAVIFGVLIAYDLTKHLILLPVKNKAVKIYRTVQALVG